MITLKNESKYSQFGQDSFVLDYFNNKRNGIFIDIGAYDGVSLSNTYYLEKELGWTGICFEPIPNIFNKLEKNRNCVKIMAGVSNKSGPEIFTYIIGHGEMLSGITQDYDTKHLQLIKEVGGINEELSLKTVVLDDILEEYKIYEIDYLSLDTEGSELKILKSINWDKFNIKVMTIENAYNKFEQTDFVLSKGYHLLSRLGVDDVFIK